MGILLLIVVAFIFRYLAISMVVGWALVVIAGLSWICSGEQDEE